MKRKGFEPMPFECHTGLHLAFTGQNMLLTVQQIVPANQLLGTVVDIVLARRREHGFDLLHVDVSLAAGCSAKKSSDDQTLDESCFDQQEA